MMAEGRILVVGAGFAGASYARTLAEAGYEVDVIDRRSHLAGNAYDEVDATGVRVHRYGPHLFHTNNAGVVRWLQHFGRFVPYEHRVEALLGDGRRVPLPVNRNTIRQVFGVSLPDAAAAKAFLATQVTPIAVPANAAEYLASAIGTRLTDLFFRPYTRKMWDLDLEELDASVVKRIPIRFDDEDRYFPGERFQLLPHDGYARVFRNILDHAGIVLSLDQPFDQSMLTSYAHCFNSMSIDDFFDYRFGVLPYRSIRFHDTHVVSTPNTNVAATVNFTDNSPLTRATDWSLLPNHRVVSGPHVTITSEEPCDHSANNGERYYPVNRSDGRNEQIYERYRVLAEQLPKLTFIGRCGTYRYLDMHQVINQSLKHAQVWLEANSRVAVGRPPETTWSAVTACLAANASTCRPKQNSTNTVATSKRWRG
jgi:UDP-galactopyranose mutase